MARSCPSDTLLKANSAFHLALLQQSNLDDVEGQPKFDFIVGTKIDRETVFDADYYVDQLRTFQVRD